MKAAVVYYTMSGNTELVAQKVAEKLEADVIRIYPKKAYSDKGFGKFLHGGGDAVTGAKPSLKPYEFEAEKYDTIVLGAPVWASRVASPMKTFAGNHPDTFPGKTIGIFMCQSGRGAEKAMESYKVDLDIADYDATMVLIDPLRHKNQEEENEKRIDEFCEKIKATAAKMQAE